MQIFTRSPTLMRAHALRTFSKLAEGNAEVASLLLADPGNPLHDQALEKLQALHAEIVAAAKQFMPSALLTRFPK